MFKIHKTFTRWVGKNGGNKRDVRIYSVNDMDSVGVNGTWIDRGTKLDWDAKDWPPRKVRVTITVEEVSTKKQAG